MGTDVFSYTVVVFIITANQWQEKCRTKGDIVRLYSIWHLDININITSLACVLVKLFMYTSRLMITLIDLI